MPNTRILPNADENTQQWWIVEESAPLSPPLLPIYSGNVQFPVSN